MYAHSLVVRSSLTPRRSEEEQRHFSPPLLFYCVIYFSWILSFFLEQDGFDMFAEQWFDKYTEKDGSEKEKRLRRSSLMAINFDDSDDEEDPSMIHLGTINEDST